MFASEGEHTSFASRDDLEMALLHFLLAEYEHVSWERVLSGPAPVRVVVNDRVGLLGAARAVLSDESVIAERPSPTWT